MVFSVFRRTIKLCYFKFFFNSARHLGLHYLLGNIVLHSQCVKFALLQGTMSYMKSDPILLALYKAFTKIEILIKNIVA